jgi:hypothetical protein
MADTPAERAAKEAVRRQEQAIWTDVERIGRALRAAEAPTQTMTQADRDAASKKPLDGIGA